MKEEKITRVKSLKPHIIPAIIIGYNTLKTVSIWQLTQSTKSLEYYENIFKEVVGFELGNRRQYFTNITGMLFSFILRQYEIMVWDTRSKLLYHGEFPNLYTPKHPTDRPNYDAVIPTEIFDEMISVVDDYARGKIRCSKCKTSILFHEVAGTMYAGSYCSPCWEGGVKQQEARENYE